MIGQLKGAMAGDNINNVPSKARIIILTHQMGLYTLLDARQKHHSELLCSCAVLVKWLKTAHCTATTVLSPGFYFHVWGL